MFSAEADYAALIEDIGRELLRMGRTISVAESCSGGMIGMLLTSRPGSSKWFKGGVIAYSNDMKTDVLDVPVEILEENGAVSEEVAVAMARGVRKLTGADYSISVTGIAGPAGGSGEKPVGTVWMAILGDRSVMTEKAIFPGGRDSVREKAAEHILEMILDCLKRESR